MVASEPIREDLLNNDIERVPSQELLLSLSQNNDYERNKAVNELIRRVREGDARVVRMGQEMELDRGNDAQIAGAIIGGWELGLSSQPNGQVRSMVQGGSEMVSGSQTQEQNSNPNRELPIISWAKATGHYFDEEQVKKESLGNKVYASGGESRVYLSPDGKRVTKFMEAWVYYKNPLLKRIDDISLQNAAGFEHLDVLGYSLDKDGHLWIVLEQDFVDGKSVDEMFADDVAQGRYSTVYNYIDAYLENVLGLVRHKDDTGNIFHMKDGIVYKDIHGENMIVDKDNNRHIIDCQVERQGDEGKQRASGFSVEDYNETTDIISKAKADGTYMKAPNGKPTNLNEEQWAMVRTKAFKNWFGDWENDPENASKVVDENGEPKVMYHGTNLTENNGSVAFWKFRPDSHFGTEGQADSRLLVDT